MNFSSNWLVGASVFLFAACGGGGGSSAPPQVPTVTLTPPAAYVTPGQQVQLTATVKDAAGNTLTAPVTWVSSNTAVAMVNSAGMVIAITNGVGRITATSEGQSGVAYINILEGVSLVTTVSAGNNHSCGLTNTGKACCWGDNSSGQLGDGTGINNSAPVCKASFTIGEGPLIYSSISAGGDHTCAIQQGGAAFCWGDNSSGELGNGTTTTSTIPVLVSGGHNYVAVSAGAHHTCGVSGAGIMYCWGDNTFGQLGNGTMTSSSVPVVVSGGLSWYRVSAGSNHTCGLSNVAGYTGPFPLAPYCWGDNSAGQLGDGTTINSAFPVPIASNRVVPYFDAISAGKLYSCGSGTSNACWGNNTSGQLGNGTKTNSAIPVTVAGELINLTMSTGASHACGTSFVVNGGAFSYSTYCWGGNNSGQLGEGTNTNSATPVLVSGGLSFTSVSAGGSHTCAVTSSSAARTTASGGVYCWGDNTYGQLGNLSTTSSSVPVNVAGPQ